MPRVEMPSPRATKRIVFHAHLADSRDLTVFEILRFDSSESCSADSVRYGFTRCLFQMGNQLPHATHQIIHIPTGSATWNRHVAVPVTDPRAHMGLLPDLLFSSSIPVHAGRASLPTASSHHVCLRQKNISFVAQLQPFPWSDAFILFICLSIQLMCSPLHHSNR